MISKHHLNKFYILISLLFILGLYHLLIIGIKTDIIYLDNLKPILYRFYHLDYNLFVVIGFVFRWNKKHLKVLWYFGFKILYNILLFVPILADWFHKSLIDCFGLVILIILIIMFIRNEKT